jgi:hypothetical protein
VGVLVVALTLRRATRGPALAEVARRSTEDPERDVASESSLPDLAPAEMAHYRARLADELARRERGPS